MHVATAGDEGTDLDRPAVERFFVTVFKVQSPRNVTGCVMLLTV